MDVFCLILHTYVHQQRSQACICLYKLAQKRSYGDPVEPTGRWSACHIPMLQIWPWQRSRCTKTGGDFPVVVGFCWDCFLPKGSEMPVNIEILYRCKIWAFRNVVLCRPKCSNITRDVAVKAAVLRGSSRLQDALSGCQTQKPFRWRSGWDQTRPAEKVPGPWPSSLESQLSQQRSTDFACKHMQAYVSHI